MIIKIQDTNLFIRTSKKDIINARTVNSNRRKSRNNKAKKKKKKKKTNKQTNKQTKKNHMLNYYKCMTRTRLVVQGRQSQCRIRYQYSLLSLYIWRNQYGNGLNLETNMLTWHINELLKLICVTWIFKSNLYTKLLLVLRAGCGIWLYQFLIIAYLLTCPKGKTYCNKAYNVDLHYSKTHMNLDIDDWHAKLGLLIEC